MTGTDTMELTNAAAVSAPESTHANVLANMLNQNKIVICLGNRRYMDKTMPAGMSRNATPDNFSI